VVAPILERRPRHAVARYWRATAVDGAAGRWGEAEATYRDLLATGPAEATWETWLVSWCHGRLGAVALERGRVEEARSRFVEAERTATAEPERAFARGHLLRLEGRADGGMPAGGR
jgi:Flp pilus assembly protein TadD